MLCWRIIFLICCLDTTLCHHGVGITDTKLGNDHYVCACLVCLNCCRCTGTAAARRGRAPQPAPRSRVNREPREEDPGLEMISRRPPKQKFANFEEYMAAHGGATAPIAGEGPLPELVPEFHLLSVPAENLVPAEDDE